MIKDKLENANIYYGLSKKIEIGLNWLKNTDLENISDGKYEIENNNIYANVQTYETKNDALFEAHRKYIDIQYMISGSETIGVTNYQNCTPNIAYDETKDIEFLEYPNKNEIENQLLNEKEFIILYPQDAHQPSLDYKNKKHVKKVVVKILL